MSSHLRKREKGVVASKQSKEKKLGEKKIKEITLNTKFILTSI